MVCIIDATGFTALPIFPHRWGSAQQPGFVLPADCSNDTGSPQRTTAFPAQTTNISFARRAPQLNQEALEPHWDLGVYKRVFLTESAAKAWYSWNSMRGDPAQPFHYQHIIQQVQQKVSSIFDNDVVAPDFLASMLFI